MAKMVLADGTLKRIHVNQHIIRSNSKNDCSEPVYTIKNRGKTFSARDVIVHGELKFVYSPDKPLSCGAKCWGETKSKVTIST